MLHMSKEGGKGDAVQEQVMAGWGTTHTSSWLQEQEKCTQLESPITPESLPGAERIPGHAQGQQAHGTNSLSCIYSSLRPGALAPKAV